MTTASKIKCNHLCQLLKAADRMLHRHMKANPDSPANSTYELQLTIQAMDEIHEMIGKIRLPLRNSEMVSILVWRLMISVSQWQMRCHMAAMSRLLIKA